MTTLRHILAGLLFALITAGSVAMAHVQADSPAAGKVLNPSSALHSGTGFACDTGQHPHAEIGQGFRIPMAGECAMTLCHPLFLSESIFGASDDPAARYTFGSAPVLRGVTDDVLVPPPKDHLSKIVTPH